MNEINKIVAISWCEKRSFDVIKKARGLCKKGVVRLIRKTLKPSSFPLGENRVSEQITKNIKNKGILNEHHLV